MIGPSADFNWGSDESVIVRQQAATAVYANCRGEIVIRQEASWDEDSDTVIIVRPENAHALARAIIAEAEAAFGESSKSTSTLALAAPTKDRTAAERQKRYRDRRRNGITPVTPTVTERNGVTLAAD